MASVEEKRGHVKHASLCKVALGDARKSMSCELDKLLVLDSMIRKDDIVVSK